MRYRKLLVVICGLACLSLVLCRQADANKTAVTIQGPGEVSRGSDVILRITVTHNDNTPIHYTDWVYVMVNNKEVARWTYSAFKRPESGTFIKEVTIKATDSLEVKAEGNCNLHGSAGPATFRISLKD